MQLDDVLPLNKVIRFLFRLEFKLAAFVTEYSKVFQSWMLCNKSFVEENLTFVFYPFHWNVLAHAVCMP